MGGTTLIVLPWLRAWGQNDAVLEVRFMHTRAAKHLLKFENKVRSY